MTRRTRSILMDAGAGKMYTNVTSAAAATPDTIIAGTKPLSYGLALKGKGASLSLLTLSTKYKILGVNGGTITNITYSFNGSNTTLATPAGLPVKMRLRKVSSSGTTTTLGIYTLPIGVYSGTITFSPNPMPFNGGDKFYWDILQIGTGSRRGQGLIMTITYYAS